jgi:hypothetical protein
MASRLANVWRSASGVTSVSFARTQARAKTLRGVRRGFLRERRLDGQPAAHQVDIAPGEGEGLGADPKTSSSRTLAAMTR